jgi:phosphate transporter
MEPPLGWLQWFIVSLPVGIISILLIWLLLLASYKPSTAPDGEPLVIKEIRPLRDRFTRQQYWVVIVCLFTIALWCVEHEIHSYVGDMGVIAIIPIVLFFSTGVLKKVGSNNIGFRLGD